jgi:acetolactate synthase-1/2/3 large subunit
MPDQLATIRSFYKRAERVEHPGVAALTVAQAFQTMLAGRPGPVAIETPWEIFTQTGELGRPLVLPSLPPPPMDTDKVDEAARLIATSRAPMIFVGSGAFQAQQDIRRLAERLQAPVVAFRSGRGILSNAHELGLTIAEAYELWRETDLVIGIGTRLEVPRWRWPYRPENQKTIRIDIDPVEMRRSIPDVAIVADAAVATAALVGAVERFGVAVGSRLPVIRAARAAVSLQVQDIQPQMAYLQALRDVLPVNGIVTDELSQVGFASWYGFPVYEPRSFISFGYQGNLGSGYQTALGAKVAFPDRPVVAICGDGGFMFGVQEVATAAQFDIGVIALVFNNRSYGNVLRDQINGFDGRILGSELSNPDFVKLADAFGVAGARVSSPDAFRSVLEKAIASNKPWIIDIDLERNSEVNPWRFIHPARHPDAVGPGVSGDVFKR